MRLLPLLLLFALSVSAQNVNCEVRWNPSSTIGVSNIIYLARAPIAATNLLSGYRYDVGTNVVIRAILSPGIWNIAVTAKSQTLESSLTLLTFTVPGAVSGLTVNILQ